MKNVDLHPEELFDRKLEGSLEGKDEARLEAHLEHCSACDFERQLMEDFNAHEEIQPTEQDEALLSRALDHFDQFEAEPSRGRERSAMWVRLAVAAAILLMTGGSAAAVISIVSGWIERRDVEERGSVPEEQPDEVPQAPGSSNRPAASSRAPGRPPAAEEIEGAARAPQTETSTSLPPPQVPPPRSRPSPPPRRPDHEPTPTHDDVESHQHSATELMRLATEARRAQDYHQAVQLYQELGRRYPGSREEVTSRVPMGRLLLHQLNDPAGALRAFDRYLQAAPQGTLAQEALVGQALSFGRLGRSSEERRAWSTLLERHAGSVHGPRARRRLQELEAQLERSGDDGGGEDDQLR